MKITKSELKEMIREALREELQCSANLREAVSDSTFYITYQESYGDSFTSYFISDSDMKSQKHWQKDMHHFEGLAPPHGTDAPDRRCCLHWGSQRPGA